MCLSKTIFKLLMSLSHHRKTADTFAALETILNNAFPDNRIPENIDDALQVLIARNYIDARWQGREVEAAALTPVGRKYLEKLLSPENTLMRKNFPGKITDSLAEEGYIHNTDLKKLILILLNDHRQFGRGPMDLDYLLSELYPCVVPPRDLQKILAKLQADGFVNLAGSPDTVTSAAITPEGQEYLEALVDY